MKFKIVFVYPELFMGGSTTSLISLLNVIDYSKYEVHLVLYNKRVSLLKNPKRGYYTMKFEPLTRLDTVKLKNL